MEPIKVEDLVDWTAFCDPAGGKSQIKKQQARSAIVVVARDWLDRIFVMYAWADRTSTDKLYEKIFWVNSTFTPSKFGIEANGMQSLFGDGVRREARLTNVRIPLVKVLQPNKIEKPFRNRAALQPMIAQGRLFLQDGQLELEEELATHPMSATFDLVDALSSAISMLPKRAKVEQDDDEIENMARYLRKSGAPAWIIERRVQEYRMKRLKFKDQNKRKDSEEMLVS